MIVTILAIAGACFALGAVGATMQARWGLFFLFPAVASAVTAPLVACAVIALMATVEALSGANIRAAYDIETFWSAALIVGMALGFLFAIIAVIADRKPAPAPEPPAICGP